VRDPDKDRACALPGIPVVTRAADVVAHPQVDVVVEATGDVELARSVTLQALESGRPVVTANKALLGSHGPELWARAEELGVPLSAEASVGAGVPMLGTLAALARGDQVTQIRGILNGTTNFVLTHMEEHGSELEDALTTARALGFAEADASRDVDGRDSADKLAILVQVASGEACRTASVFRMGIASLTARDVARARGRGLHWRLVASAVPGECLRVEPELIPRADPLAQLEGAHNLLEIRTRNAGTYRISGPGAGGDETACAILSDLAHAATWLASRRLAA
jgi:homoserine dehydrogenase